MNPEEFSPSPELAVGLQRDSEDGRPVYELVVPRRPIVEDLALVPTTATFAATRGTAARLDRITELKHLQALWANPASVPLLRACAQAPALRAIYVCHFKRLAEVSLAAAPALEKGHALLKEEHELLKKAIRFCSARKATRSPSSTRNARSSV